MGGGSSGGAGTCSLTEARKSCTGRGGGVSVRTTTHPVGSCSHLSGSGGWGKNTCGGRRGVRWTISRTLTLQTYELARLRKLHGARREEGEGGREREGEATRLRARAQGKGERRGGRERGGVEGWKRGKRLVGEPFRTNRSAIEAIGAPSDEADGGKDRGARPCTGAGRRRRATGR